MSFNWSAASVFLGFTLLVCLYAVGVYVAVASLLDRGYTVRALLAAVVSIIFPFSLLVGFTAP